MKDTLPPPNSYWLDENDRIIRVSAGWDQFAMINDGHAALSANIIGKPLTDFINGARTRHWMQTVLALTRLRNEPIEKLYRCDSTVEKRFMRMDVIPEPYGVLQIKHTVLVMESLPTEFVFNSVLFSHKAYISRCSNCLRLHIGERWLEPDEAYYAETLDLGQPLPVIYDVCKTCRVDSNEVVTYF